MESFGKLVAPRTVAQFSVEGGNNAMDRLCCLQQPQQ